MTTATLCPPQNQSPTPTQSVERRLATWKYLIHDAAWKCASRYHQEHLLEDMVQEANIAIWRALQEHPNPVGSYIWHTAYYTALNFLRRGRSVERPVTKGETAYQMVSLEALMESRDGDGWDIIEGIVRRRHGELPNPTQDIAVAHVMYEELQEHLTPRQRQVLALRLQEYTELEIARLLGVSHTQAYRIVAAIRIQACALWDGKPEQSWIRLITSGAEYSAQHKEEYNARRRARRQEKRETLGEAWYAQHREAINAKRRARRQLKASVRVKLLTAEETQERRRQQQRQKAIRYYRRHRNEVNARTRARRRERRESRIVGISPN